LLLLLLLLPQPTALCAAAGDDHCVHDDTGKSARAALRSARLLNSSLRLAHGQAQPLFAAQPPQQYYAVQPGTYMQPQAGQQF
jgi:hypothetical protein